MKASSVKPRECRLTVFLLLLMNSRLCCPQETHTLRYDFTVRFPEDSWEPLSPILVYADDELFLRYKGDSRRAEAVGPKIKGHTGAENWARKTEDLQRKEEQLRRMLAAATKQLGQETGLHTLQETLGCELQGNQSTGGFWRLGYDGQDSLTFDQKTLTWTMTVPSTQQTKVFWKTHAPRADEFKTFLEDICPAQLQGYLAFLKNFPPDTGLPEVKVTNRTYPVGRITLTCWAFNLYSREATLAWLQDGKQAQQRTFGPGTVLPSGDGTYQTWVSIWVLPGQEPEFTCRLRHQTHDIKVPAAPGHAAEYIHDAAISQAASAVSALPIVLVVVLARAN
ncbi:MHC class I-like protein MILL2 [Peromyscus maniculatus bairdii]|uniref:Hereditary hemochromatosis protein-like n=1 Tax=Peromyscus maniculatus bairdii TaxID=230844 RepID=A0A6I9M7A5_PERMB|nr:MHC class I-like protein MILL2 [Peromyscus maniculatus bairdii]